MQFVALQFRQVHSECNMSKLAVFPTGKVAVRYSEVSYIGIVEIHSQFRAKEGSIC